MQGRARIIGGPHLYSGESGSRILWTYVGALWLVVVVSAAFFGWSSLMVLAGAVGTCVAIDLALSRLAGSRNPASLPHAVLTGLLVGLSLPVMTDMGVMLRIAAIAAAVASLLGKWIFGGMGHYIWHPALVGILAVHFLFPTQVGMIGRDEQFGADRREKYLLLSNNSLFVGDLSRNQSPQFYQFGPQRSELLQPNDYGGWSVSLPAEPA
ncbi:MAG: RnfABCDGE type electron transport complex subunit D, partial [Phycisphaerae bacterium]|nr:RnfABCDGE type electron transport complex subunit D [Phycisphaerae bacterium]